MSIDASNKRILIVDDDENCAKLLRLITQRLADVETAENGSEGLKKLGEEHFDVIISDIDMPVMSGIEMYREAKKIDPKLERRLIFFTATDRPENIFFLEENNLNYLQKPAPLKKIMDSVEDIINWPRQLYPLNHEKKPKG